MPIIEVAILQGYSAAEKARLMSALSAAAISVLAAPRDATIAMVREIPHDAYQRGGAGKSPGPAPADPAAVCRGFLAAMEARDLDAARAHLADGFTMVFPGGATFTTLEQLVAWSAGRYSAVTKTIAQVDVAHTLDGPVVWVSGTLSGTAMDGSAFSGIRFTDRFTMWAGRLTSQQVWNDLAEHRP